MSPLPSKPWEKVKCDFFGPIPSGEYLFVVIDEYTRFPIVKVVKSTASNTVIPIIDKIFSTFGIPDILSSDYGPPFNGHDIRQFSEALSIEKLLRSGQKQILSQKILILI